MFTLSKFLLRRVLFNDKFGFVVSKHGCTAHEIKYNKHCSIRIVDNFVTNWLHVRTEHDDLNPSDLSLSQNNNSNDADDDDEIRIFGLCLMRLNITQISLSKCCTLRSMLKTLNGRGPIRLCFDEYKKCMQPVKWLSYRSIYFRNRNHEILHSPTRIRRW